MDLVLEPQALPFDPNWLFKQTCDFTRAVDNLNQLHQDGLPEVCFVGRSNVGKSSLVNALVNRKALARTSNTPGRTQQLIFFDLAHKLYLVDLPGYGYAEVSKTKIAAWNQLLRAYLRGRVEIKRVFLLIDGRHGIKPNDLEMMDMLDESAVSYQIVLTKADKVKQSEEAALIESTKKHIV
jgi:GTP-binding protein